MNWFPLKPITWRATLCHWYALSSSQPPTHPSFLESTQPPLLYPDQYYELSKGIKLNYTLHQYQEQPLFITRSICDYLWMVTVHHLNWRYQIRLRRVCWGQVFVGMFFLCSVTCIFMTLIAIFGHPTFYWTDLLSASYGLGLAVDEFLCSDLAWPSLWMNEFTVPILVFF